MGAADAGDFFHCVDEKRTAVLVGPDGTDGEPRGAGEGGEGRQVGELLPDRLLRVGHRLRVDVGVEQGLLDRTDASGDGPGRAEVLAEHDAPVRSRLTNQPGRLDRGRHVGRATERGGLAGHRGHLLGAVHTVLEGQHRSPRPGQRPNHRNRAGVVVGFDREHDQIGRTQTAGSLSARARTVKSPMGPTTRNPCR